MNYLEFKQAAKKHYRTCECLLNNCEKHWQIDENIYYLCGYTIEMMLKYHFFRSINYKTNKDIKELNYNGITYSKQNKKDNKYLQEHSIEHNIRILRTINEDIILKDILSNFRKWNVSIRYNGKRNNYSNLKEIVKLSKETIEKFGD